MPPAWKRVFSSTGSPVSTFPAPNAPTSATALFSMRARETAGTW